MSSAAAAAVVAAAAAASAAAVAAAEEEDYEYENYPDAAVVIVAEHIYYLSPRIKFRSPIRRGGHTTRRLSHISAAPAASAVYYAAAANQVTDGKGDFYG